MPTLEEEADALLAEPFQPTAGSPAAQGNPNAAGLQAEADALLARPFEPAPGTTPPGPFQRTVRGREAAEAERQAREDAEMRTAGLNPEGYRRLQNDPVIQGTGYAALRAVDALTGMVGDIVGAVGDLPAATMEWSRQVTGQPQRPEDRVLPFLGGPTEGQRAQASVLGTAISWSPPGMLWEGGRWIIGPKRVRPIMRILEDNGVLPSGSTASFEERERLIPTIAPAPQTEAEAWAGAVGDVAPALPMVGHGVRQIRSIRARERLRTLVRDAALDVETAREATEAMPDLTRKILGQGAASEADVRALGLADALPSAADRRQFVANLHQVVGEAEARSRADVAQAQARRPSQAEILADAERTLAQPEPPPAPPPEARRPPEPPPVTRAEEATARPAPPPAAAAAPDALATVLARHNLTREQFDALPDSFKGQILTEAAQASTPPRSQTDAPQQAEPATARSPEPPTAPREAAATRLPAPEHRPQPGYTLATLQQMRDAGEITPEAHDAAVYVQTQLAPGLPLDLTIRAVRTVSRVTAEDVTRMPWVTEGRAVRGDTRVGVRNGVLRAVTNLYIGADLSTVGDEWGHTWWRLAEAEARAGNREAQRLVAATRRHYELRNPDLAGMDSRIYDRRVSQLFAEDMARAFVKRPPGTVPNLVTRFVDTLRDLFHTIARRVFGSDGAAAAHLVKMGMDPAEARNLFGRGEPLSGSRPGVPGRGGRELQAERESGERNRPNVAGRVPLVIREGEGGTQGLSREDVRTLFPRAVYGQTESTERRISLLLRGGRHEEPLGGRGYGEAPETNRVRRLAAETLSAALKDPNSRAARTFTREAARASDVFRLQSQGARIEPGDLVSQTAQMLGHRLTGRQGERYAKDILAYATIRGISPADALIERMRGVTGPGGIPIGIIGEAAKILAHEQRTGGTQPQSLSRSGGGTPVRQMPVTVGDEGTPQAAEGVITAAGWRMRRHRGYSPTQLAFEAKPQEPMLIGNRHVGARVRRVVETLAFDVMRQDPRMRALADEANAQGVNPIALAAKRGDHEMMQAIARAWEKARFRLFHGEATLYHLEVGARRGESAERIAAAAKVSVAAARRFIEFDRMVGEGAIPGQALKEIQAAFPLLDAQFINEYAQRRAEGRLPSRAPEVMDWPAWGSGYKWALRESAGRSLSVEKPFDPSHPSWDMPLPMGANEALGRLARDPWVREHAHIVFEQNPEKGENGVPVAYRVSHGPERGMVRLSVYPSEPIGVQTRSGLRSYPSPRAIREGAAHVLLRSFAENDRPSFERILAAFAKVSADPVGRLAQTIGEAMSGRGSRLSSRAHVLDALGVLEDVAGPEGRGLARFISEFPQETRPQNLPNVALRAEILRLHRQGLPPGAIAERTGASRNTVRATLRQHGIDPRPTGQPTQVTEETLRQVLKLRREDGLSYAAVAERLGLPNPMQAMRYFRYAEQAEAKGWPKQAEGGGQAGDVGPRELQAEGEHPAEREKRGERGVEFAAAPPPPGRPNLAIPVTEPGARRLVGVTDQARTRLGEPRRRPDTEVQAEADARLNADYAGERQRLVQTANDGGHLGDTDTVVAKSIINREAAEALASGNATRIADAVALVDAYRRTGTEQARAFRQRYDPVESPAERRARMVAEGILTPDAETRRLMERAERAGDTEAVNRLRELWAEKVRKLLVALDKQGVSLRDLRTLGEDPERALAALRAIQAAKADAWDKVYEFWRNSILSALPTQSANLLGNASNMAWHFTAKRLMEATINTVLRRPEGAQWGEFRYILGGILPGLSRGARNWLRAWKTEFPFLGEELGRMKIEEKGIAIGGTAGRVIRAPQRLLLAMDEFCKSLSAEMEVGAQAYRIAKAERLEGDALRTRIAELVTDPNSIAWERALGIATELAFQEDANAPMRAGLGLRRALPGVRYFIPFITTPGNIFRQGLRQTPLGAISLGREVLRARRTGDWSKVTVRAAEQVLAWGVTLVLMSNDPDDPWITGAASSRTGRTRALAQRTAPPQSVRIAGRWVSYARIEPFATVVSTIVDALDAIHTGQPGRIANAAWGSLVGQMQSKTFLDGLGQVIEAVQSPVPDAAAKLATNFAVSWVPNIYRTGARSLADVRDERRLWGKGWDWTARLVRRGAQSAGIPGVGTTPAFDLWGRPIPANTSPVPHTDILWRMLSPIQVQGTEPFVGDRILVAWNRQHPEDEHYPALPPPTYTVPDRNAPGGTRTEYMTDEQYAAFLRESGQLAAHEVARYAARPNVNADHPTERDIRAIREILAKCRQIARGRPAQQWRAGRVISVDAAGP